jgi:hypothetical protein
MWMRARSGDVASVHLGLERRSRGFLQGEIRGSDYFRPETKTHSDSGREVNPRPYE